MTTKDGYILRLFRIAKEKFQGPPVLFVHGMTNSSNTFIINQASTPPAFLLANNNYDVWLLNTRGNYFSRLHKTLNFNDPLYWDWTSHDISVSDLPASFDYILKTTEYNKINYIGNSQGGHVLLNSLAYVPEYNKKINIAALLTPFGGTIEGNTLYMKTNTSKLYINYLKARGKNFVYDQNPNDLLVSKFAKVFPNIGSFLFRDVFDTRINNDSAEYLPYYIHKFSGGTSVRNLEYYSQLKKKKSPLPICFDYKNVQKNTEKYGQAIPPRADYSKITAKLALFMGKHDKVTSVKDGETLLINLAKDTVVYKDFNCNLDHVGFLISKNQQHMQKILELFNSYQITK